MPTDSSAELTLRSCVHVLHRRKWWVIGLCLLSTGLSTAWSLTATPQYTATAQILIRPQPSAQGGPQPLTQTDVLTALQLVGSAPVAAAVRHRFGRVPAVSAAEVGQTDVIGISAVASGPRQAAAIANAYARAFMTNQQATALRNLTAAEAQLRAQVSGLQKQYRSLHGRAKVSLNASALLNQEAVLKEQLAQIQVNGANSADAVELVTPAAAPTVPSSPRPLLDALLGLAAGLLAGTGAAFLRDHFDEALASKEAAEQWGEAPVLTMVPVVASWKKRSQPFVVSLASPASPAVEAYRSLRTSIRFARQERHLQVLLVTSPAASEGKTSTVSNLGVVFAQAGERVVLVSCDLRRPRIGQFFSVPEQENGLSALLLSRVSVAECLQPVAGHDNLWILPSGPPPANPAELLGSAQMGKIIDVLRGQFDIVLLDSPPILPVTDGVVLSKEADATLMVVAAGRTRRGDLHRAREKLAQAGAALVGTVLNEVSKQNGYGYGYQYAYRPYQQDDPMATAGTHTNGQSSGPPVSIPADG